MSTLCLIRHGQASAHAENYDQLSDLGYVQSKLVGNALVDHFAQVNSIWVGPCVRHRQTAEMLHQADWPEPSWGVDFLDEFPAFELMTHGLQQLIERRPDLRETIQGLDGVIGADGSAYAHVLQVMTQEWIRGNIIDPRWISGPQYLQRLKSGLETLLALNGTQIVVTSTGTIASLIGLVLEADSGRAIRCAWGLKNASVSVVKYTSKDDRFVAVVNDTAHLSKEQQTYL